MNLFPWKKKSELSAEDAFREMLVEVGSKSGMNVTLKTAQQVSTAFACARVIAEGIAQVPLKLMQETGPRQRRVARELRLHRILSLRPNDFQTSFELREMVGLHLVFCGNAFVWMNRVRDEIVELLPLLPGQMHLRRSGWETEYRALIDGQMVTIPKEEMWHLRGPSWNGWEGLDTIKLAREALGLSLATEEHGARMFANGAQIPGVISTSSNLNEDQRKALRESLNRNHAGAQNAWKLLLLWGGLNYTAAASTNDQAQFLETRRFQVEEVCRWMRVLPIMIGHADKTQTYASAEQMFIAHVMYTMVPWYVRIEQSINVNLLTDAEQEKGFFAKFIANGLMRGASKDRSDYYHKMYQVGALNPNEIRELEDYDAYEGGDEYRVPLNMENPADPAPEDSPRR